VYLNATAETLIILIFSSPAANHVICLNLWEKREFSRFPHCPRSCRTLWRKGEMQPPWEAYSIQGCFY